MPGSVRPHGGLTVLVLGWSSIVQRRVLPALLGLGVGRVDIASATRQPVLPESAAGERFSSYADALNASQAPIVYVSTRNHEHAEWTSRVLESGRHAIVDKPAALTEKDVRRLVETARQRQRLVAEATVFPWHPQFAEVHRLIAAHGPVTRLTSTFTFPPLPAGNFRYDPRAGGGALFDLGPYAVTPGRLFFDAAPDDMAAHAFRRNGDEVETAFSVLFRYPGGRVAAGHFGMPGTYVNRLELAGPRMTLRLERAFTTPADGATQIAGEAGGAPVDLEIPSADAFALFLDEVFASAASGAHEKFANLMLADAAAMARLRTTNH